MKHGSTVLYIEQLAPFTRSWNSFFLKLAFLSLLLRKRSLYTSRSFNLLCGVPTLGCDMCQRWSSDWQCWMLCQRPTQRIVPDWCKTALCQLAAGHSREKLSVRLTNLHHEQTNSLCCHVAVLSIFVAVERTDQWASDFRLFWCWNWNAPGIFAFCPLGTPQNFECCRCHLCRR